MRTLATRTARVLAGGALAVATAACGAKPALSPSTEQDPSAGGLGGAPATASPEPGGSATSGGTRTPRNDHTGSPSPSQPPGPKIVSFRVVQRPECPKGTNVHPIAGVPVTLAWEVTGAETVALSVDGPGVHSTYRAHDRATLSFPCSGPAGSGVTHTYMIRAEHGGRHTSRTVTASAKVNEISQV